MLNIVIPMAGAGSRFIKAGYSLPKPLLPIHGIPMIKLVINNLRPLCSHRFIFIVQQEHIKKYDIDEMLKEWENESIIISINGLTEGAACSVLKAKNLININMPLMIANSDQYVDININDYLNVSDDIDGYVMTMKANDPKWSFAEISDKGFIRRIVEKEVISDEATVGIYNFKNGSDFVRSAEKMIKDNERVNGEFYVAPVYNRLILDGYKCIAKNIGSIGCGMHGLGTPEDLSNFLKHPLSMKVVRKCEVCR